MKDPALLRVLLVSQSADVWGAERAVLDLLPLLDERRVRVVLAGPGPGAFRAAWAAAGQQSLDVVLPQHRGVRHATVPGRRAGVVALGREATVVGRSAVAIARRARPFDLVQSESLWGHLETAIGGRLARRPVVLQVHDLVAPGAGRALLRMASSLSAATIAVSGAVAELTGADVPGRTTVLHHGVDIDRFAPGPADPGVRSALGGLPGVPLVGILGRLDPEKGVGLLVRAMTRLDGPAKAARLVVVGERLRTTPEAVAHLRCEAHELLGDRVHFAGRRTDVPDVMRAIDVLVSASTAEPFGLTILEAMASGTAVVAVAAGGVPEIVDDGQTGLLVPPGDEQALADALERVCSDAELRARLGARARAATEARHRPELRADQLVALYRQVVTRRDH
ncbi:MAG: glycosyltransferase family 4 protein [Actinomycetota bacterium]|nr:glycosyltransferase family 4 protein [Actinomycetota bacterium]